jgi:hypothetical protein
MVAVTNLETTQSAASPASAFQANSLAQLLPHSPRHLPSVPVMMLPPGPERVRELSAQRAQPAQRVQLQLPVQRVQLQLPVQRVLRLLCHFRSRSQLPG